ncbi:MAG: RNA polymerase subunit sigma-54 [Salinibacter sp.]
MTTSGLRPRLEGTLFRVGRLLVLGALVGLLATAARAQRDVGSWTLGPQVGRPGGLTAKYYRSALVAYDATLTVDGDDFVRLSAHRLWEQPLPDSLMHVYYGPGLLGIGRRLETDPALKVGVTGKLGLNFYAERFEVFLHVAPAIHFEPRPAPRLGLGVGLRYDLRRP